MMKSERTHSKKRCSCTNLRYWWVTCVTLSNFCNFSRLVLSTHPLLLYQFCRLVKLLPSSHLFLSTPFLRYLRTLKMYLHHAPNNANLTLILSYARSLRQYTFQTQQASSAIVPFWFGGIETWLGVFSNNNLLPSKPSSLTRLEEGDTEKRTPKSTSITWRRKTLPCNQRIPP